MKNNHHIKFSETLRFAWKYVSLYPIKLAFCLLGIIIFSVAEILVPIVSGLLVDYLVENADHRSLTGAMHNFALLI